MVNYCIFTVKVFFFIWGKQMVEVVCGLGSAVSLIFFLREKELQGLRVSDILTTLSLKLETDCKAGEFTSCATHYQLCSECNGRKPSHPVMEEEMATALNSRCLVDVFSKATRSSLICLAQ